MRFRVAPHGCCAGPPPTRLHAINLENASAEIDRSARVARGVRSANPSEPERCESGMPCLLPFGPRDREQPMAMTAEIPQGVMDMWIPRKTQIAMVEA